MATKDPPRQLPRPTPPPGGTIRSSVAIRLSAVASAFTLFLAGAAARAEEPSKPKAVSEALPDAPTKADSPKQEPAKSESRAGSDAARKAVTEPPLSDEPEWEREKNTRRSGLTVGIQLGVGLGKAAGYPLDLKKIGRIRYYTETDIGVGSTGIVWIGGALKDWFTFGLGVSGDLLFSGDKIGVGYGALFRVETFPLWTLGGRWRDAGVMLDAGTSALNVSPASDFGAELVDGGAASYLGGGAFYEGFRFWHAATGPGVYGSYMWSDTVRHGTVSLVWRLALYTGP